MNLSANKFLLFILLSPLCFSQEQTGDSLSTSVLKKLSLEELMNIEVTSVSGHAELLSETASAIQVITQEDIRRSGVTRIPEALRLAVNLEVDKVTSRGWAISARGFNSTLANKLLVLIDGRTVYSPLFAGVFWEAQDVLLKDVDQIEVISGPGATLWGANAVNGVINITTKKASDTKGIYAEIGGGTELKTSAAVRYGNSISPDLHFRIYGKYSDFDQSLLGNGQNASDQWNSWQGGFRLDWDASEKDIITFQGDLFENSFNSIDTSDASYNGSNLVGRWSHSISESSDFTLQLYFDYAHPDIPGQYNDRLNTYDFDFQHKFLLNDWNYIIWGAGYKLVEDNFESGAVMLSPEEVSLKTFSTFFQDEITIVKDILQFTAGVKVEHNDYTHLEVQPGGRILWKINDQHNIWAAVSHAVRTPSRLDRNFFIPMVTTGSPNFTSEKLIAYELGYRTFPTEQFSISLSTYYNSYDDIRSIEMVNPPLPAPLVFGNGQEGESYGVEITADYNPIKGLRFRPGYSLIKTDIDPQPGSTDDSHGASEMIDSEHHFMFRSSIDIFKNLEFEAMLRYVSKITNPNIDVPDYSELDLCLIWHFLPNLNFTISGQNLLHDHHIEFGAGDVHQKIERSVFGRLSFSL